MSYVKNAWGNSQKFIRLMENGIWASENIRFMRKEDNKHKCVCVYEVEDIK